MPLYISKLYYLALKSWLNWYPNNEKQLVADHFFRRFAFGQKLDLTKSQFLFYSVVKSKIINY